MLLNSTQSISHCHYFSCLNFTHHFKENQRKGMHAAAFLVQIQEQQRHRLPLLSHCLAESTTEQEL